ncbi:putative NAD-dependent aldehyde dehydrogenase, partial [Colletotrichum sublineola]
SNPSDTESTKNNTYYGTEYDGFVLDVHKNLKVPAAEIIKETRPHLPDNGVKFWPDTVFPYLIIVNALIPALLTGNTVILKPSPQTPLVATRLIEIFQQAGMPKDVLTAVQSGDSELVKQLVQLPDIKLVGFTGSTAGGLAIQEASKGRFLPLNLDLGGNNAAYVRPDADLYCCAVERIYVYSDVHDKFVEELQKELHTYKLGDPMDSSIMVGPVISRAAQKAINAQVQKALSKGAIDVTLANPSFKDGNYVAPVLLTRVTQDMAVMKEETFGPVIPVARVASDDEAVRLINDSDYGLTASVWTRDILRGEEIIEQLEAGTVFINRCDYPNPDMAWTGWKKSGLGCTLGPRGFDAFFKLKSYHIKEKQG